MNVFLEQYHKPLKVKNNQRKKKSLSLNRESFIFLIFQIFVSLIQIKPSSQPKTGL